MRREEAWSKNIRKPDIVDDRRILSSRVNDRRGIGGFASARGRNEDPRSRARGPYAETTDAAGNDDGARKQRRTESYGGSLTSHPITVQSVMFDAAVVFYAATSKRCARRSAPLTQFSSPQLHSQHRHPLSPSQPAPLRLTVSFILDLPRFPQSLWHCVLSRDFGSGEKRVTAIWLVQETSSLGVVFRMAPLGRRFRNCGLLNGVDCYVNFTSRRE